MTTANETIDILDELTDNFVTSSLDTNMGRAFPDVRDGLKPGMRTILWEMWTKKYLSSKPHVKSAKISGGVIANWWPHSDVAIYETFARMSQPFINNVPEVDFHGANGNIILGGDAVANQRYTEARLSPIVEEGMFEGINKDAVDMVLNFSEDAEMPTVLPAVFPRLLVNGAQGIGVSISNVWIGHNLQETGDLILEYMRSGVLNSDTYYPDFPTGGTIVNKDDLATINNTGKGKVIVEAAYKISGREINFYEMPYQVYIEPVIEQIKSAIEAEKIHNVKEVLNKSDKKRTCLTVVCARGADVEKILIELFTNTDLRKQYNANQNGIISRTPRLLNLKQVVDVYIDHNCTCIKREHTFEMVKAKKRIHILEGLLTAIGNIDEVINIIRNDGTPSQTLKDTYSLDDDQVKAILDMKLARLSKLEVTKVNDELSQKQDLVARCNKIIESEEEQKQLLQERLAALCKKYGTPRKSKVIQKTVVKSTGVSKSKNQPIVEDVIVMLTNDGYFKAVPVQKYRASKTPNRGLFKTTTENIILAFSNKGKMYRFKADKIKMCGTTDKGTAAGAILQMEQGESILSIISNDSKDYDYVAFATVNGVIKKTKVSDYQGTTQNIKGMKAINLKTNDSLKTVAFGTDVQSIMMITRKGYCVRFASDDVNYQGKAAAGVKGITLRDGDEVVDCILCNEDDPFFVIGVKGNSKLVRSKEFALQGRGGKGATIAGEPIAGILQVTENDSVQVCCSSSKKTVKMSNIKISSKSAYGEIISLPGAVTEVFKI